LLFVERSSSSPGSAGNPIHIDELLSTNDNTDSPLSSIYEHYDDCGNFYTNVEEVPSASVWRPEPSLDIPLMVPPTLDQHLILLALQGLLDPAEPTYQHGNVHAICGQRRVRTEGDKRKKQYRVIYSNTDIDDPELCLTTNNTNWISYSDLIANPDLRDSATGIATYYLKHRIPSTLR
jgi:hypothetical protein